MTLWMLWSLLLAATVGIAALALERAATGFGAPRRHIWTIAVAISVFVPVLLALRRTEIMQVAPVSSGVVQADADVVEEIVASDNAILPTTTARRAKSAPVPSLGAISPNQIVLVLWIAASGLMALAFARSMLELRRRKKAWINAKVGAHEVLLSAEDGPAVIGFAHPSIVFPRWALTLDSHSQEMMLRHETEHIRTGDPRVLLAAGLALVLLPWNAGLWWLVRRLRMAMELDCDARVIQSVGTSHEYGLMLLEVCERRPRLLPLASALASTRPLLERRIDAMSLPRPRRPMRAAVPFLIVALVATTAAFSAPRPASMLAPVVKVQQLPTPAKAPVTTPATPPAKAVVPSAAAVAPLPTQPSRRAAVAATPTPLSAAATPGNAPTVAARTDAPTAAVAVPSRVASSTAAPAPAKPAVAASAAPAANAATPDSATPVPYFGAAATAPRSAVVSPLRRQKPERAKIAAFATQHARAVVRGDTVADYIVMVLDASGRYVWSTHGQGGLSLEIAGDPRTPQERRQYSSDNRAELVGAALAGGGAGGSVRLIAPTGVRDSAVSRAVMGAVAGTRAAGAAGGGSMSAAGAERMIAETRAGVAGDSAIAGRIMRARAGDSGRVLLAATPVGAAAAGGRAVGGGGRVAGGFAGAINNSDSAAAPGTYSTRIVSSRSNSLNAAWGLQESGRGQSGIQGLPSAAVSSSEMYIFAAQELAPQMLRVVVLHLAPNTVWTHRF